MVVYGKLYRDDGYKEGGGRGWEGNNSRSGVYAWGNQVSECCDFGLVGSDILTDSGDRHPKAFSCSITYRSEQTRRLVADAKMGSL